MKRMVEPPKAARRFLAWYCRSELLEDLEGALYEYYYERMEAGNYRKARWMFWLDVIMHVRPHTIKFKTQTSGLMLVNHVKVSFRNIRKHRLSSVLNTLGLSSGLACFMLIFFWVNKELNFDNTHQKKDRIYRVANTFKSESEEFSQAISGPALGAQLDDIFAEIEESARYVNISERLQVNNEYFFESEIALVDHNFLKIFDFNLLSGNKALALDDPTSIVLTEALAKKYFGDKNPVGSSLYIEDLELQVTGIIENPSETSQMQFSALLPTEIAKTLWGYETMNEQWGGGALHTYVLLKEGTEKDELEKAITAFIGEKLTDWAEHGMYYTYFLQPLTDIHLTSNLRYDFDNGSIQTVNIFIAAALVILLLACINYINLATANAITRAKEVGVRKVIGVRQRQLIMQYLIESFLIVTISVVMALLMVWMVLPIYQRLTGYTNFELFTLSNILFLFGLMIVLSLLAGSLPAYLISSVSSLKVIKGNLSSGNQFNLLRKGLVTLQFSATIVLLISILVVNDQMSFIRNSDLGMQTDGIIRINYRGYEEMRSNVQVMKDKLLELPEVKGVAFESNSYPVDGLSNSGTDVETGDGTMVRSSIYTLRVDEAFAETMGLELVAGRFYDKAYPADSTGSIVVNEACIYNFGWKDAKDAIGKKFGQDPNQRKVIGVVRNFNFEGLHKSVEPARILPVRNDGFTSVLVNAELGDVKGTLSRMEEIWNELVPTIPFDASFMSDDLRDQYLSEYNFQSIFNVFSIISIIIGCLGLFGLTTATTNRRIKELGIRKVLGASIFEILAMINKEFVVLIVIAALVAGPVSYYFMNVWLDNFSYHITFNWLFMIVALVVALVLTIATVSLRAYRAAVANPAHVLKDE